MKHWGGATPCQEKFWIRGEYLHWWVKNQQVSVPVLVTTTAPIAGFGNDDFVTGQFSPVFGPANLGTNGTPGARLTAGLWLDDCRTIGLEASGFWLSRLGSHATFSSDNTGNPFLGIPFILQDGTTQVAVIALPATLPGGGLTQTGSVTFNASTRLWGLESNAVLNLIQSDGLRLEGLAGVRYLRLEDSFEMRTSTVAPPGSNIRFNGAFVGNGSLQTLDSFTTRNQFIGGQVGLRGSYDLGPVRLALIGKLAIGSMRESVDIHGRTLGRNAAGALVGNLDRGYFAMPNNSGSRSRSEFCLIPEVEARVSYALTERLSAFVGYDYLYVSRVARAAGQLDNHTDSRLQPRNAAFDPNFLTNVPGNDIRSSSFWAQGVNVGLEFRW